MEQNKTEIEKALESVCDTDIRIRIWYGDSTTGISSEDDSNNTIGFVKLSSIKTLMFIPYKKSPKGLMIPINSIIKIVEVESRNVLYQHQNFSQKQYTCDKDSNIYANGEFLRKELNQEIAIKYCNFMNGIFMKK